MVEFIIALIITVSFAALINSFGWFSSSEIKPKTKEQCVVEIIRNKEFNFSKTTPPGNREFMERSLAILCTLNHNDSTKTVNELLEDQRKKSALSNAWDSK